MSKQISLTPNQAAALAQCELCMHLLGGAANGAASVGATSMSAALVVCVKTLERAHEDFIKETQRTVSIAAPADIAKLVAVP
jgi:hypothetical protein